MKTRDRAPEMSQLGCPCAYGTPPPWTPFHVIEHHWHHLTWEEVQRSVAGRRATYEQAQEMCRAQSAYISALHAQRDRERRKAWELRDRIVELEADLDELHRSVS